MTVEQLQKKGFKVSSADGLVIAENEKCFQFTQIISDSFAKAWVKLSDKIESIGIEVCAEMTQEKYDELFPPAKEEVSAPDTVIPAVDEAPESQGSQTSEEAIPQTAIDGEGEE